MKCRWCKGVGTLTLRGRGSIPCLNCNGSGEGTDGGKTHPGYKPWMVGNKHQSSKRSQNICQILTHL